MKNDIRAAVIVLCCFTFVCGVVYPASVTVMAQLLFPHQANGSLVRDGDRVLGSALVGQAFTDAGVFHARPSATTPPYNAMASAATNWGPLHPARLAAMNPAVPRDLVSFSASGLDPHISPAAAFFQVERIAAARGVDGQGLRGLVQAHIEARTAGILGEPRVNVFLLNRALAQQFPPAP